VQKRVLQQLLLLLACTHLPKVASVLIHAQTRKPSIDAGQFVFHAFSHAGHVINSLIYQYNHFCLVSFGFAETSILATNNMFTNEMCLEVLVATIVAWIGLWGLVEELLDPITDKRLRCLAYSLLLCISLLVAGMQKQVTVCGLL